MARRTTKGPLDNTDSGPLSRPSSPSLEADDSAISSRQFSNARTPITRPSSVSGAPIALDVDFLTRPSLYRSIPSATIPSAILRSKHQPPASADLASLLSHGHYRHAAVKAATQLTSGTVLDATAILSLYHTRLAALILAGLSEIAIPEARPLLDWIMHHSSTSAAAASRPSSAVGPAQDGRALIASIPWPLRILLHRLSTLGSGDGRRGIMGLYVLGAEARTRAADAARRKDEDAFEIWSIRARELGSLVLFELVEMGELESARRMVTRLPTADQRALALLRIGDVQGARDSLASGEQASREAGLVAALIAFVERDYETALAKLLALHETCPDDEVIAANLALAYVYTGHLEIGRERLEKLVVTGVFKAPVTNLASLYELSGDKSRTRKIELVATIADRAAGRDGTAYELQTTDFKL